MRLIPSTLLVLIAAVAAGAPAHAQVRETEPFGGRPFGAPPGTPPADSTGAAAGSGAAMGAPGMSSVTAPGTPNPGTPSLAIAPAPMPAPPPPPPPAPPPPAPASSPAPAQAVPSTASPQGNAAAPAATTAVGTPFGANRNAPTAATATTATASTAQQPPVRGLPPDAPKLVISGSVYSPDPAKRMLIVNGQPVREGADAAQGIVVHEVRPESAVLGFKGSNYTVVF